jgi:hypothetical protein
MKRQLLQGVITLVLGTYLSATSVACTIFVLTDSEKTLFFNNEDYSNPATRIWFLPGTGGLYGTAYVGFDNDWAQGGVNTQGLAFDWVAGFQESYQPDAKLLALNGNPSERMLESCATVEQAIAFYKKYREPSFSYARILIADKTGASVIIRAQNGQLFFDRSHQSRGFGYGEKALAPLLASNPTPSLQNGLPILRACSQQGEFATKYSSIYDLRTGDIFLVAPGKTETDVTLNLAQELGKGGHYFDLPALASQVSQPLKSLLPTQKRLLFDGFTPIASIDPALDQRVRQVLTSAALGNLQEENFSPEFWKLIAPEKEHLSQEMKKLGSLKSITLFEQANPTHPHLFLYGIEFENAWVLQRYGFDGQKRISSLKTEGAEAKGN